MSAPADGTQRGAVRVEPTAKRVRGMVGGEYVFDTTAALLVWEGPRYPAYYIPRADVSGKLVANGRTKRSSSRGEATEYDLEAGGRTIDDAARAHLDSPIEVLRDYVRFEWSALDAWFEENEEVYIHPRSPYARIDILQSSRHVRVEVDGVTVAESSQPRVLFETGLPERYYLPKTDVRMDLLTPNDTRTGCPYKGFASYYDLTVNGKTYENFVWWYPSPLAESQKIGGLVCFYNEKVDLYVDGVLRDRPRSPFS